MALFGTATTRNSTVARTLAVMLVAFGCGTEDPCRPGAKDALSTCRSPTQTNAYYVDQAQRYFDALDESAAPDHVPTYSTLVARWEWPPWLYLTGYTAQQMAALDKAVKSATPATLPKRDCRAFAVQPFARCRASFEYEMGSCPIYEEFTFNDQGEITFIEAWSDLPQFLALEPNDPWAEGPQLHRLSTRIPGLGNATGLIDPLSEAMTAAGKADPEIADFVARTQDFWTYWLDAYGAAGDDLFARGCGW
jgi:hypothetical protein